MADGMIFWLPEGSADAGWVRVVDGRILQRGQGRDWRSATHLVALPAGEAAMLIVPASDIALHWIACPGMTVAQGAAAAALMAQESSIGPASTLHAVSLAATDAEHPHIVAVTARAVMEGWLLWCVEAGVLDAAIVPAALVLPAPETGFIAAPICGEEVLRGMDCAVGRGQAHAALIVGDGPIETLSEEQVDALLIAALSRPPLDLRAGSFARRPGRAVDSAWLKRIAVLAGCVALGSLLIALVTIARLHIEAEQLDRQTLALAQTTTPDATDAVDAETRLAAKVTAQGGSGGFTGTAAGVMTAIQGVAGARFTSLSQMADGSVRVQLAAPRAEDIAAVITTLRSAGWSITGDSVQQQGAQAAGDFTVTPS